MQPKIILALTTFWVGTLSAAYWMGQSTPASSSSLKHVESETSHPSSRSSLTVSPGGTSAATAQPSQSRSISLLSEDSVKTRLSIAEIHQLTNPLERSRQLLALIDSLAPDEFGAALQELKAADIYNKHRDEQTMLLHAWAKVDPLAALEFAQNGERSTSTTKEVLSSWANENPTAALAWARENHEGTEANPWLVGIVKGLINTDPDLATQVLQELPFSEERGEAMRELAPHIAQLGVDEAQAWVNSITDPRLSSGASAYLADIFSKQDPAIGAQWVSSITDTDARQRALSSVVENWTNQDPDAAQQWIQTLSPDDQAQAGPKFVNSYASQDANAAADWLDNQTDSENYQTLLGEFARGATRSDPELALNYGNELEDDNSRSRTVGRALWTLYRKDKASARTWIGENELPERVQRYVGRMLEDK